MKSTTESKPEPKQSPKGKKKENTTIGGSGVNVMGGWGWAGKFEFEAPKGKPWATAGKAASSSSNSNVKQQQQQQQQQRGGELEPVMMPFYKQPELRMETRASRRAREELEMKANGTFSSYLSRIDTRTDTAAAAAAKPWSLADSVGLNSTTLRALFDIQTEIRSFWTKVGKGFESVALLVSTKVERDLRTVGMGTSYVQRRTGKELRKLTSNNNKDGISGSTSANTDTTTYSFDNRNPFTLPSSIGIGGGGGGGGGGGKNRLRLLGGVDTGGSTLERVASRKKKGMRLPLALPPPSGAGSGSGKSFDSSMNKLGADAVYRGVRSLPDRLRYDYQRRERKQQARGEGLVGSGGAVQVITRLLQDGNDLLLVEKKEPSGDLQLGAGQEQEEEEGSITPRMGVSGVIITPREEEEEEEEEVGGAFATTGGDCGVMDVVLDTIEEQQEEQEQQSGGNYNPPGGNNNPPGGNNNPKQEQADTEASGAAVFDADADAAADADADADADAVGNSDADWLGSYTFSSAFADDEVDVTNADIDGDDDDATTAVAAAADAIIDVGDAMSPSPPPPPSPSSDGATTVTIIDTDAETSATREEQLATLLVQSVDVVAFLAEVLFKAVGPVLEDGGRNVAARFQAVAWPDRPLRVQAEVKTRALRPSSSSSSSSSTPSVAQVSPLKEGGNDGKKEEKGGLWQLPVGLRNTKTFRT
jgi:hypothetical protein